MPFFVPSAFWHVYASPIKLAILDGKSKLARIIHTLTAEGTEIAEKSGFKSNAFRKFDSRSL
jgi:hypothetical protein